MAPSTYYAAKSRAPSAAGLRDAVLGPALVQLWKDNYRVYGARKLWKTARRAGHDVGRDQVARLMRAAGITGTRRIRVRRSITYVRKTGLVEGPTKNHTARTVPIPAFVARLLETRSPTVTAPSYSNRRGGGHLTLGQARYTFQKAAAAVTVNDVLMALCAGAVDPSIVALPYSPVVMVSNSAVQRPDLVSALRVSKDNSVMCRAWWPRASPNGRQDTRC